MQKQQLKKNDFNKVSYVLFFTILLFSCQNNDKCSLIQSDTTGTFRIFSISLPPLIKKGNITSDIQQKEGSRIDSLSIELSNDCILQIFNGAKFYKSQSDVMPVIGDGLSYHAILFIKTKESVKEIYFFKDLYKEGFFENSKDILYEVKLQYLGRKIIDSLITLL